MSVLQCVFLIVVFLLLQHRYCCVQATLQIDTFVAERFASPIGANISYNCTVSGGGFVVWLIDNLQINTGLFSANGQEERVGNGLIAVKHNSRSASQNWSVLIIPSDSERDRNRTSVTCGITTGRFVIPSNMTKSLPINVYGPPTAPSNVVISQSSLDIAVAWQPSFTPFNIPFTYTVWIDGDPVKTLDKTNYTFTLQQPSCSEQEVVINATNDAGTTSSDTYTIEPTAPIFINDSTEHQIELTDSGFLFEIIFMPVLTCAEHPVLTYTLHLRPEGGQSSHANTTGQQALDDGRIEVKLDPSELVDNVHYFYTVEASNGLNTTQYQTNDFYTTDVQLSQVTVNDHMITVICSFILGSFARGCVVQLTANGEATPNITAMISRHTNDSDRAVARIQTPIEAHLYNISVFDWESNGSIGYSVSVVVEVCNEQERERDKCFEQEGSGTGPSEPIQPTGAPRPIVIISGVVGAVVISSVIIIICTLICCLKKKSNKATHVGNTLQIKKSHYVENAPDTRRTVLPYAQCQLTECAPQTADDIYDDTRGPIDPSTGAALYDRPDVCTSQEFSNGASGVGVARQDSTYSQLNHNLSHAQSLSPPVDLNDTTYAHIGQCTEYHEYAVLERTRISSPISTANTHSSHVTRLLSVSPVRDGPEYSEVGCAISRINPPSGLSATTTV